MYVEHTIEVLRELRRVLKSDGVVFWNIGDSYNGSGKKEIQLNSPKQMTNRGATAQRGTNDRSLKPKDLCLVPFRTAVAAQEDNWWVRQDIIWAKPNPMPEPVRDRFTDAYEHILMFTKSAKYFWDADACQEPAVMKPQNRFTKRADWPKGDEGRAKHRRPEGATNPETRNMRNVWIFATQPFKGAHFATFPEELPRRCIQAATRSGDTVLDPFCGSGTTGKVALELGRKFIGTDLEYQELAKQRIESAIIKSEFD
jgi:DNA modification methylase